jgi:hypothetical protein
VNKCSYMPFVMSVHCIKLIRPIIIIIIIITAFNL